MFQDIVIRLKTVHIYSFGKRTHRLSKLTEIVFIQFF